MASVMVVQVVNVLLVPDKANARVKVRVVPRDAQVVQVAQGVPTAASQPPRGVAVVSPSAHPIATRIRQSSPTAIADRANRLLCGQ